MPTFKNNTEAAINRLVRLPTATGLKEFWARFEPGEEKPLLYWVPWEDWGLTLTDTDPIVPPLVLTSGTWDFNENTERKFTLPTCGAYSLDLIVQKGSVKLYAGDAATPTVLSATEDVPYAYHVKLEWRNAPWLKLVGTVNNSRATLHVEVLPDRTRLEDF